MTQGKKKSRRVKCPRCDKLNEKELAVEHNKKYYCPDCLKQVQNEKKEYNNLYDYICELFEIEKLNGWHFKQIKDMKEKYGYSYKQIRFVLKYFFEVRNNSIDNAQGIGIVPFVFDEAQSYYIAKREVAKSAKNKDMSELNKSTTITIKKSDIVKSKYHETIKEIDLDDIELDDEE